ncbi:hypothetical protein FQR65_LT06412 [Abscondita terminalis]|nr:hypothetical protein FQR65_LT06412 [Abscondita terminalis]
MFIFRKTSDMSVQLEETVQNYNQSGTKTHAPNQLEKFKDLDDRKDVYEFDDKSEAVNPKNVVNSIEVNDNDSCVQNKLCIEQVAQFSISNPDRKRGLKTIIGELKEQHVKKLVYL